MDEAGGEDVSASSGESTVFPVLVRVLSTRGVWSADDMVTVEWNEDSDSPLSFDAMDVQACFEERRNSNEVYGARRRFRFPILQIEMILSYFCFYFILK